MDEEATGKFLFETLLQLPKYNLFRVQDEIRPSEFMMLSHIYYLYQQAQQSGENGSAGVQISTLSSHLNLSKPGVSQTIRELEKVGFVQRRNCSRDRRAVYVTITEEGRIFVEQHASQLFDKFEEIARRMGPEDVKEFIRLFDRFIAVAREVQSESSSR